MDLSLVVENTFRGVAAEWELGDKRSSIVCGNISAFDPIRLMVRTAPKQRVPVPVRDHIFDPEEIP